MAGKLSAARLVAAGVLLAVITGGLAWVFSKPDAGPAAGQRQVEGEAREEGDEPDARWREQVAAVAAASSPAEVGEALAGLRELVFGLPPEEAGRRLVDLLGEPGFDRSTGRRFAVAADGGLGEVPSVRVALLDWLGQLDPARAAAVADEILATPGSPDEWAVCLRNKALAQPGERDALVAKTRELLRHEEWREKPSAGYLEAFDVLVHSEAVEALPDLAELIADRSTAGRAPAYAAYLTLDRLMQAAPLETMRRLRGLELSGRPAMRAQLMARADVRDPRQRAELEAYLVDPRRSAAELDAFARIFPNANFALSNNLLSETRVPGAAELRARDRAALGVLDEWLREPRMEYLQPQLSVARRRLESQLGGEGGGGGQPVRPSSTETTK